MYMISDDGLICVYSEGLQDSFFGSFNLMRLIASDFQKCCIYFNGNWLNFTGAAVNCVLMPDSLWT